MRGISQWLCLAMAPAIEREEAESRGWFEQAKRLVHIAAQSVLEEERRAGPTFPKVKIQTVMRENGHKLMDANAALSK